MSFDPNKSQINESTLAEFLRSELSKDLTTIPGIGQTTADTLQKEGIATSHQLLGFFLMLNCNVYNLYGTLKSMGIKANKNTIVHALATKTDILLPGTYAGIQDDETDTESETLSDESETAGGSSGYAEDEESGEETKETTALKTILARLRTII